MSEGKKFDKDKAPLHMIPEVAIEGMALAFAYGAKKYGEYNYRNGIDITRLTDSLGRHLLAYLKREDNDPESGLPHTYHILANAAMIEYMRVYKPNFDNRFKSENDVLEVSKKIMNDHSNTFLKLKETEDIKHKYELETLVTIGSSLDIYEIAARYYNENLKPIYMLRTKDNKLFEEKEEYLNEYKGMV